MNVVESCQVSYSVRLSQSVAIVALTQFHTNFRNLISGIGYVSKTFWSSPGKTDFVAIMAYETKLLLELVYVSKQCQK